MQKEFPTPRHVTLGLFLAVMLSGCISGDSNERTHIVAAERLDGDQEHYLTLQDVNENSQFPELVSLLDAAEEGSVEESMQEFPQQRWDEIRDGMVAAWEKRYGDIERRQPDEFIVKYMDSYFAVVFILVV